jgi:hypothetical protein
MVISVYTIWLIAPLSGIDYPSEAVHDKCRNKLIISQKQPRKGHYIWLNVGHSGVISLADISVYPKMIWTEKKSRLLIS